MTVKEVLRNMVLNFLVFIKKSITKMFVHKVVFSAKHGKIKSQVRKWKSTRNVFLLESFYHKARTRAKSYEIVWYVEENALTRWCGLAGYKQRRHVINQPDGTGLNSKR